MALRHVFCCQTPRRQARLNIASKVRISRSLFANEQRHDNRGGGESRKHCDNHRRMTGS
jgi:hypothetical protein